MKAKKFAIGVVVLVAIMTSGCAQQIRPSLRSHIGTEHIFDKNYEIGQQLAAYVGQPIVKVKDYKVNLFNAKYMRASDDFVITGGFETISGDKNTDYAVRGETTLDGATYKVLNLPGSQIGAGFGALVDKDGGVHSKILNNNIVMVYTFSVSPTDLRFLASKDEEIDVDAGYLNYELIYGGTDGKSITITYREYTSKDLARLAFYQNVVYEAGKKQIRFRDTVLQIEEATNEKIVFAVLSDGLEN